MNKEQFLSAVSEKFKNASALERARAIDYYSEMIDDRIEDGMSEEQAVACLGSIDDIGDDLFDVKSRKKMSGGRLAVILSLSIVTVPLLIAAYSVIWSLVVGFYCCLVSFGAAAVMCVVLAVKYLCTVGIFQALLFLGGGIFSVGCFMLCTTAARHVNHFAVWLSALLARLVFLGRVSE